MNTLVHSSLPRRALFSNASDAAGYQLYSTALSIIVVTVLGFSATQVGLLNALGTLSFLFLVVPIGALVDRIGAPRILVLSLALKTTLALATLLLVVFGLLNTATAMAVVTVMGVAVVASENAQVAVTPMLVGAKDRIADLVARMTAADRVAGVVAPAAAGALLALGSAAVPLALALALFVLALLPAASLLGLRTGSSTAEGAGSDTEPEASSTQDARRVSVFEVDCTDARSPLHWSAHTPFEVPLTATATTSASGRRSRPASRVRPERSCRTPAVTTRREVSEPAGRGGLSAVGMRGRSRPLRNG
ncbi:MAG: MFS transporter [Brachybacterium sp.]